MTTCLLASPVQTIIAVFFPWLACVPDGIRGTPNRGWAGSIVAPGETSGTEFIGKGCMLEARKDVRAFSSI
jgi:hypothetical protein